MRQLISKRGGVLAAALVMVMSMARPGHLLAQPAPATLQGHVTNSAGIAETRGEVKLTTDKTSAPKDRKFAYTFPVDASGNYKGTGIAPGDYVAIYFVGTVSEDFFDNVGLKAGETKTQDFDMSRKEYLDKMTPEEKKNLEEFKKKNAEAVKGNQVIANLNTLLTQSRADIKAGNYDPAIASMKTATEQKPDEAILFVTLGDAQLGAADAAAKAARAAGKSVTDPTVSDKYTEAANSYKKAIDLNAASKKPSVETAAAAYNQMGQAYGKMGDVKDSGDAYEMAAKTQPTSAGMYYFNEAATFYNAGKTDEAAAAADKAIAADPKRADAYYIKAQSLIPKASVDPKTQKITAPPGCVEAYQQYLELAPDGPRAEEVKGILTGIGAQVKSSYKAGKTR